MGVFYHEEEPPPDPTNRCGCLAKALKVKEAFSHCHNLSRQVSCRTHEDDDEEEDNPLDDPNEEQEAIVLKIWSRAIEKLRHKSNLSADGFSFVFSSPGIGELPFFTTDGPHIQKAKDDHQGVQKEEFASIRSFFTRCSRMVASREALFSAKSNLSLFTSLNDVKHPGSAAVDLRGALSLRGVALWSLPKISVSSSAAQVPNGVMVLAKAHQSAKAIAPHLDLSHPQLPALIKE